MKRLFLLFAILPFIVVAQKMPSIEEKTKDMKKLEGFFNIYFNEDDGKIWLDSEN